MKYKKKSKMKYAGGKKVKMGYAGGKKVKMMKAGGKTRVPLIFGPK